MSTDTNSRTHIDPMDILKRKVDKFSFLKSLNLANLSSNSFSNYDLTNTIKSERESHLVNQKQNLLRVKLDKIEKKENVILRIPKKIKEKFKFADFTNFVKRSE
jgi:hypothetical protein